MALNQDYLGKVYPASPAYEVGREKIAVANSRIFSRPRSAT